MSNKSDIRRGRNCVFKLHVHLVFVAKYRRRVFDARAIDVLRAIFADVCSDAHATLVDQHRPPMHRAAEDPGLTFRTASLSALSFPVLKDGACRAFWSTGVTRC